jgi:hypothetical protein
MSNVPVRSMRVEVLDLRRHEFIDLVIPTLQVQRANFSNSPAATTVIGSHRVGPGSVFKLLEVAVGVGSASSTLTAVIALTHTGTPLTPFEQRGTRDLYTFQRGGEIRNIYRWDNAPTFGAGTLNWKTLAAANLGSRGHSIAFKGIEYPLAQGISTV